jgi:DNA polymerase-4
MDDFELPFLRASYPQAILHLDADAFFASVSQALNPRYQGKPVVTGAERGVVIALSYEAKAFGIKRGMLTREAKKLCPKVICLPGDFVSYGIFSERIFAIMRRYTPTVEEYSIDEAFADLKGLRRMHHCSYADIARKMQNDIHRDLGLTVSVGLSLSKSLAKLASKAKKPAGFVEVPASAIHRFLKGIPLIKVWGFGANTVALLNKYGMRDALDFVRRPRALIHKLLGKTGDEIWQELNGVAVRAVDPQLKTTYQSMSKFKTFSPGSSDRDFLFAQLLRNLERCATKLRRFHLSVKRITFILRLSTFRDAALEIKLDRPAAALLELSHPAKAAFGELFEPRKLYRATGVVFHDLVAQTSTQFSLFEDPLLLEKSRRVSAAVDEINQTYGRHQVHLADSLSGEGKQKEKLASYPKLGLV